MSESWVGWPFAEVAVDVPLRSGPGQAARPARDASFHYTVPPQLADRLRPGQLVRVPFGRRQALGIVIALRSSSPVERTRDISEILDAEPALSPADIALARWMNQHYLAPFFACLRSFLPPGGPGGHVRQLIRSERQLQVEDLRALSEPARAILGLFQRHATVDDTRIASAGIKRAEIAIDSLIASGLVKREMRLRDARVKPKRLKFALARVHGEAEIDAALRKLKPSRKADLVAFLRRPDSLLPSIEESLDASGANRAALRDLAKEGHVTISPAERRLEAAVDTREAQRLAGDELARKPAQARLLLWLAAAGAGIDRAEAMQAAEASRAVVDALVDAGQLRAIEIPSSLLLNARGGRAREIELELRRAKGHGQAMAYLAAAGGRAPVSKLTRETAATHRNLRDLDAAELIDISDEQVWRDPLSGKAGDEPSPAPALTDDQARAWETLAGLLGRGAWSAGRPRVSFATRPRVCLLHGVTGSGKTELYLKAIEHTLFEGRQAVVLVPEIALTPQTVRRFAGRFPGRVGVWHSELSEGERLDTWERARRGLLDVIVGSRSAIFAPLPRLGLLVLDESHGEAYKQARTPRYHARDLAIRRAALSGALVLLGSATPSVESYWRASKAEYSLLELPRRVATRRAPAETEPAPAEIPAPGDGRDDSGRVSWGELPPVEIVDLRAELRSGNTSIFSRALQSALTETLEEGGQAILFLNRRGSATFVLCRDCGHVLECPRCQTPLTHHRQGAALVCHHCNHHQAPPMMCPSCGSSRIRFFGAGTERVEAVAREAFPDARIVRWDADTTGRKGAHEAILARFVDGSADILVGTQMIAKGLDLPRVTLVGVVSADTGLHFPDFRSAERSFQLLSQVAGRAGRSERGGQVIFQTYAPDNPAIIAAANHDYAGFYAREIAFRQAHGYPPFGRLIRLIHVSERVGPSSGKEARRLAGVLRERIDAMGLDDLQLIGPAPAFFGHVRGRTRWHLILRGRAPRRLLADFSVGPGWRIDVDPVDLL